MVRLERKWRIIVLFYFFKIGDDGDTYFIILKGSVSVLLPNQKYKAKFKKGIMNSSVKCIILYHLLSWFENYFSKENSKEKTIQN